MQEMPAGVYPATKKDGTPYFRASLTYKRKHISLGSFADAEKANAAYLYANGILRGAPASDGDIDIPDEMPITVEKYIAVRNLRDNGIYCRGPIYLRNRYFDYYLDRTSILRFSAEELFYYMNHAIQRRGGHLFVSDYGSQIGILTRYGVRPFAVKGRDYYFKNSDENDFRYGNIVVINRYAGVRSETVRGRTVYITRIHVNGDLLVGRYDSENEAAIAYNKAADMINAAGIDIAYTKNYIEDLSELQYRLLYDKVRIRKLKL